MGETRRHRVGDRVFLAPDLDENGRENAGVPGAGPSGGKTRQFIVRDL
jgi:hypothetical protein